MKNKTTILILLVLGLASGIKLCQSQFTAELINMQQGTKRTYLVSSDGEKYRYDIVEDGKKIIVIADPVANRTAILYSDTMFVRYLETNSPFSAMMDPNQGYKKMQNRFTPKDAGTETILGFKAKKRELYAGEDKVITGWHSEELGFLMKILYEGREDTYVELTNIKKGEIDDRLFKIPEDYIEIDDQMRIKIPEPPPPDSWNTIEAIIPVKGEFTRGDKITFNVQDNKYLYFNLKNETSEPAKIIRIPMRNGKDLPEAEQMPISYRTKRLYANETESFGSYFEPGDDLIIEVHEGKMLIEISKEKR